MCQNCATVIIGALVAVTPNLQKDFSKTGTTTSESSVQKRFCTGLTICQVSGRALSAEEDMQIYKRLLIVNESHLIH